MNLRVKWFQDVRELVGLMRKWNQNGRVVKQNGKRGVQEPAGLRTRGVKVRKQIHFL